jgi:hypothetical protein
MQGDAGAKAKHSIFVLIWNCSTEHFQVSRQALAPSAALSIAVTAVRA